MSVFKCKMCGGTIEFNPGETVGVCDSCGTKQTLPRLEDDRKQNLFDRADHYRRNHDYDKAMTMYERILEEDTDDAEVYWSLVLCRYGIEYVEDPATHKRVPTVNRAQFTSVFDDDNYKFALQYADGYQKVIYEEEAKAINEIQKGILAISQKEEPFDVFICYKETDEAGRRTPDSVLGTELYHELTEAGYKVFFSRITLEDKLGIEYEPYIFGALNSAKVMVVLGTKPEYFEAVWVKNEWSRYLALIKQGQKKMLIPAYRDMDPYDLPEEFSHLQAQDMSKLGFMQDLTRGIQKIVGMEEAEKTEAVKETVVVKEEAVNIEALLKRAFLFLEDGEWKEAYRYSNRVLDQDPENGEAYLVKLLADMRLHRREELGKREKPFDEQKAYQKVMRFGDEKLVAEIKGYNDAILKRKEDAEHIDDYHDALDLMESADTSAQYEKAAKEFEELAGYRDADDLAKQCLDMAEECRKDETYYAAKGKMNGYERTGYELALRMLESLGEWRDAKDLIPVCKQRIEELKEEEKVQAKKQKKVFTVAGIIGGICLVAIVLAQRVTNPVHFFPSLYAQVRSLYTVQECKEKTEECVTYMENIEIEKQFETLYLNQKEGLKKVKKGDTIKFGVYEQDGYLLNGKEEIEWMVLDVEKDRALLLSKYALDRLLYHNESAREVLWEESYIREWLNNSFFNSAFGSQHQADIPTITIVPEENKYKNLSKPYPETEDKIFLLSVSEVEKYLPSKEEKICHATAYAEEQGAYISGVDDNCHWWLRSPRKFRSPNRLPLITAFDNDVDYYPYDFEDIAVRPAMWIQLD